MKKYLNPCSGYTIVEMIVAAGVAVILSVGVMAYTASTIRLSARNLATNHSHESARGSMDRMFADLHNSASRFQLISFDGTTYSDVTAAVSSDKDPYSQMYISNRANGVRFLRLGGGPFKITGNGSKTTVSATDTTIQVDVGSSDYAPSVGDKVQIPLINQEFDVTTPAPTKTGTKWKVTLSAAVGFSFVTAAPDTTTGQNWSNPIVTAYFYQRVGYTVLNNQLRFHPYLTDPPYPKSVAASDVPVIVRNNITSPKPFGLLFSTATSTLTDALYLRVSLESYDTNYSARVFQNATTTLQSVVPSRSQPPVLSTN